ncbi:NUDIX hydrolase [Cytobacillus sp. FJAT-54145]|uniref:NUDIX hydrolase n=1 Tax=Cytobacillus spartinae TaxID=3299023 RepID=A0ABW6KG04_9BACI
MQIENIISKFKNRSPVILGSESFSKYAVLLPLLYKNEEIHILFEVRSLQLRRQPGEICFPGGRVDKTDEDEMETAVRETSEELQLDRELIKNVYPLDFMVTPFGTMIYPFVGVITEPENIVPNPAEVGEVFTVPLSYFLENSPDTYEINFKLEPESNFPFDQIAGGEDYNWQTRKMMEHFYYYDDKVIWGLTARILGHFIEVIKQTE